MLLYTGKILHKFLISNLCFNVHYTWRWTLCSYTYTYIYIATYNEKIDAKLLKYLQKHTYLNINNTYILTNTITGDFKCKRFIFIYLYMSLFGMKHRLNKPVLYGLLTFIPGRNVTIWSLFISSLILSFKMAKMGVISRNNWNATD